MRFDKFTLKAQEVIQTSQQLAEKFNHQQIEPEHLVKAILEQTEGFTDGWLPETKQYLEGSQRIIGRHPL